MLILLAMSVLGILWVLDRSRPDFTLEIGGLRASYTCGCEWVDGKPESLCAFHREHGALALTPQEKLDRLLGRLETQRRRFAKPRLSMRQMEDIDKKTRLLLDEIDRVKREEL